MAELEFGAPVEAKKRNRKTVPSDIINKGLSDGKTPEQFLSVYEYEENDCQDVIIFRKPTIRDLQIYDLCKFENGYFGVIIGIRSYTQIACAKHLYNFGIGWSSSNFDYTKMQNPMKVPQFYPVEKDSTYEYEKYKELQILLLPVSVMTVESAINYIGQSLQGGQKFTVTTEYISNVVEIHKNVYPAVCRKMEEILEAKTKKISKSE